MTRTERIRTKATQAGIVAYDLSRAVPDGAPVEPAAVFPVEAEPRSHAAAPDLGCAVYTTDDALVCVGRDGGVRWRSGFDAAPERYMSANAACAFSLAGDAVWLYRPDLGMKGPGHTDRWLAFDAATGGVLGQADLGSAGHGATHLVHPDGERILLDVGQGQDGSRVYCGRLDDGGIVLTDLGWDGTLYDLSPDGSRALTVREAPGSVLEELVVRDFPGWREEVVVPAEELGYQEDVHETFFIGFVVGHLDADTAIVSVRGEEADDEGGGEPEELEFHHNHLVDVREGRVVGALPPEFLARADVLPLGDGSWLTTGSDGRWYRHTL